MTLRHIYLRKGTSNEGRGKSEGAHGEDINIIHVRLREADNNPDFVDLVEFLKTSKHDPRVNTKFREPVKLALMRDVI
jgi:hypothetical protein